MSSPDPIPGAFTVDVLTTTGPATAETVLDRTFPSGAKVEVVRTLEAVSRIRADGQHEVAYRYRAVIDAPSSILRPDTGEHESRDGFETPDAAVAWINEEITHIVRLRGPTARTLFGVDEPRLDWIAA